MSSGQIQKPKTTRRGINTTMTLIVWFVIVAAGQT